MSSLARAKALTPPAAIMSSNVVPRMRADWQSVMTPEETDEFGALEKAITHTKQALTARSLRRAKIRNRLVQRLNWRKHVGNQ